MQHTDSDIAGILEVMLQSLLVFVERNCNADYILLYLFIADTTYHNATFKFAKVEVNK